MELNRVFAIFLLSNIISCGLCTSLAMTGYIAANPNIRNFLIQSGLSALISRKAEKLYKASNFRHVFDQGTNVRKAQMDTHDIIEVAPTLKKDASNVAEVDYNKRVGLHAHENLTGDDDRMYSERLFGVVTEMDKNECVSRLLCEIGADPKSFGIVGLKINHYIKSVPPVTWNSATFPYMEAFHAGLRSSKGTCRQHYVTCMYDMKRVMKFLWIFTSPINPKM